MSVQMTKSEIKAELNGIFSIFTPAGVADDLLEILARETVYAESGKRNLLERANVLSRTVFFFSGHGARLEYVTQDGRCVELISFAGKDLFFTADLPELSGGFSLHADRGCRVMMLDGDVLREVAYRQPSLYLTLLAYVSGHLAGALALAGGMMTETVEERVMRVLERTPATSHDGYRKLSQRYTQQQLAGKVGACRETVSRAINGLIRDGKVLKLSPRQYALPIS